MESPPGTTLTLSDRRKKTSGPSPRPHIFLAFECARPGAPAARWSLADVDEIIVGRGSLRSAVRQVENNLRRLVLRVPDPWMSSTHATITQVFGRWVVEDANSKNGTIVNGEPQQRAFLVDGDLVELGHSFFLFRDALPATDEDPAEAHADGAPPATGLVTLIPSLARTFRQLEQVAHSDVSIVLQGESGTGKEVVARAIHAMSARKGGFVAVNCGALPDTLVETELFGYRKGAFSGAAEDRPGLVRSADGGTLLLDEIGDLPPPSQAAFLRVLQEREVMPVGGTRPIAVDVRVVAASHRDLEDLVTGGKFRADLLARISGVKVVLPPLRERREDLGLLVAALLRRVAPDRDVVFEVRAARALFRHTWPLNIRELEKCLAAAVVFAGGELVELEHLPPAVAAALDARPDAHADAADDAPLGPDDEKRKKELVALLQEHRGNISAVSRAMGKARMQIQRWLKRYHLDPEKFR